MEKIAYELKDLLHQKQVLYQQLIHTMEQEQTVIGSMEMDALWKTTASKKKVMAEIESLKIRLKELFNENFLPYVSDADRSEMSALVRAIPVPVSLKRELSQLADELSLLKKEARELASENRRNINEYLGVFSSMIDTMVGSRRERKYTGRGILGYEKRSNPMIRAEV